MVLATEKKIAPTEYLEEENKAETKTELINGELFPMSGASVNHNRLTSKLHTLLSIGLDDRDYEVFVSDMRVWLADTKSYVYPDIVIVKGNPIFADDSQRSITNPFFIAEVLSPSTERYDKKAKFDLYKSLLSLEEYLVIYQNIQKVELYHRLNTNQWLLTEFSEENSSFTLESVNLEIHLLELYKRVVF